MDTSLQSSSSFTDQQLLAHIKKLAATEREATASLIASLAELDARRLHLGEGFPSLFSYCTEALHLSEHAAYNRIEAARAARKWPVIFEMIADGSVTMTAVRLLAGSLTDDNHRQLLSAATHKSKREVEQMVATLHPQPPVPSIVRKLPTPNPDDPGDESVGPDRQRTASEGRLLFMQHLLGRQPHRGRCHGRFRAPAPAPSLDCTEHATSAPQPDEPQPRPVPASLPQRRPAVIAALAPERYKVQMTVSRETHDKLRRVQGLLRHQVPDGDPAVVFDRALTLLLQDLERKKLAAAGRPRPARASTPGSRHVPAAIRREVWKRDEGQCAFVGDARRCTERGFLGFHHVIPYADGGPTTAQNLQLRCRAHNAYEAEELFGPLFVREEQCTYSSFRNESRS